MTLIKFTQVHTLEPGGRLYSFSDEVLGKFHAFKVTAESTQILERKKEDKDYLGLFSSFDQKVWTNLIDYLNPRDLFRMVVATRNMNGLHSINQLRNSFVYLRNPLQLQTAFNDYHLKLACFHQLNERNHEFQTGFPILKLPLLQLYITGKMAPLPMIIPYLPSIAGDLKVVSYNPPVIYERGVHVLGKVDMLADAQGRLPATPLPDLHGLLRLDLNGTMISRHLFETYIKKAPNLMHLKFRLCTFDETWGMPVEEGNQDFSEGVSLEKLQSLDVSFSTIHPPALFAFLRIAKNLQHLDIRSSTLLANMDFNAFGQLHLPLLESFTRSGHFPWSLDRLRALTSAAPNLKKLVLCAAQIDDGFFLGLQPSSFGGIEELDLSNMTINDHIICILKAAPRLKKLILTCTDLKMTIDLKAYRFPEVNSLDLCESTITWTGLSGLLTMMPNLKELGIEACSGLYETPEIATSLPITTLETIDSNFNDMDEDVIDLLLRIAPNLKNFAIDYNSEDDEEEDEDTVSPFMDNMMKYCTLAARGHKIIHEALEVLMRNFPEKRHVIETTLAMAIEDFKAIQAFEEKAKKHALQNREDSSSKRQKPSDE